MTVDEGDSSFLADLDRTGNVDFDLQQSTLISSEQPNTACSDVDSNY